MSSFALCEVEAFLAAGGAEDGKAWGASQLDAGETDSAASAVNQNSFRGVGLGRMIEGMIGSSVGDPDAGALTEAGFFWKPVHLAFQGDGVFGVGAGDGLCHVDAVAGLYLGDAGADGFDRAGAVGSGRVGQRRLYGVGAVAHVGVVGVHAYRVNPHEDLSCGGVGGGGFFHPKDFGGAEFVDKDLFPLFASGWRA